MPVYTAVNASGTVTITETVQPGYSATLRVEGASGLGAAMLAFVSTPLKAPVETASYRAERVDTGLKILTKDGSIIVPWQYVSTIGGSI